MPGGKAFQRARIADIEDMVVHRPIQRAGGRRRRGAGCGDLRAGGGEEVRYGAAERAPSTGNEDHTLREGVRHNLSYHARLPLS